MVALQISVYPTVRDDSGFAEITESYPEVFKELLGFGGADFDYTSPAGYLGIELFSLMVPLLLIIAAVATGARGIAGEEEGGTLDLLLSLPVTRRRVAAEKLAATGLEVVVLGLVLLVSLWVGVRAVDMDLSIGHLAAAVLGAVLLAMGFGAIALLVGAATGRRGVAIGIAAALAAAAYLVNSLAALVSQLETLQRLTPSRSTVATAPSLPSRAVLKVVLAFLVLLHGHLVEESAPGLRHRARPTTACLHLSRWPMHSTSSRSCRRDFVSMVAPRAVTSMSLARG